MTQEPADYCFLRPGYASHYLFSDLVTLNEPLMHIDLQPYIMKVPTTSVSQK